MSDDVPTVHVVRPARPYDWLEDEPARDVSLTDLEEYEDGERILPLPDGVDPIALRQADLVESRWSGFVTSQLPDLTVDYDRTGFVMGKPRKSRRRGPPASPISPYTP